MVLLDCDLILDRCGVVSEPVTGFLSYGWLPGRDDVAFGIAAAMQSVGMRVATD